MTADICPLILYIPIDWISHMVVSDLLCCCSSFSTCLITVLLDGYFSLQTLQRCTTSRWCYNVELFVEHEADREASCNDGCPSSLELLQSAFPDHSQRELDELLTLCNGDIDSVSEMLTSWQTVFFHRQTSSRVCCWHCAYKPLNSH